MAINVSIQYNSGLFPEIILLIQCYYHRGNHLNVMKRFCLRSLSSNLNVLTFFPPVWNAQKVMHSDFSSKIMFPMRGHVSHFPLGFMCTLFPEDYFVPRFSQGSLRVSHFPSRFSRPLFTESSRISASISTENRDMSGSRHL